MVPARALAAVVLVVVSASCGGDGGGSAASTTASTAETTAAPASSTTTVAAGSTSVPPSTPSTLPPYGSPCRAGSHPDCIDPDGDGEHELLQGGAECIKALGVESGLCSDLDGDGRAGYPDSG